jgi:hypothetical protein
MGKIGFGWVWIGFGLGLDRLWIGFGLGLDWVWVFCVCLDKCHCKSLSYPVLQTGGASENWVRLAFLIVFEIRWDFLGRWRGM